MHSGFRELREHCPMDLLARTPRDALAGPVAADVRRIVAIWQDCRRRFGGAGPYLFGAFTAADAMYAPVASRFRTYIPDLAAYGDDGTAAAVRGDGVRAPCDAGVGGGSVRPTLAVDIRYR